MRVLCVCVTLVAVIPRCILAQPVSGSGSVTAKAGDAWLDDGFNSGDAGRGHGRGALDGAEEESTDLDRIMDEHIADLEEKPKTIKDLMKVLLDVDFTVHPTLENLVETFKTNVDIALKKLPSAVELAKASVAEDRLSRKKKELASSMGAETNIKTRALRSSAAAKKPEADTVETSDNGSETVPNADGQDDDDAYDGDIGSDDDDSFDNYETTNDYSADDSADNLQNYTGNAYSSFTSLNSTRKKTAGGRGRGRSRSHDPFGSHTSPNHHRQKFFKKIQQGIYDGNHDHLMRFLGGAQAHDTRAHREFMDIQHNSRRRLSEDEELMGRQCMLLAKCTKCMSLYDTMVYFYR
ncbi:expressed unknown protein [Seminavis robusta]|uniref:Uncharacterized protein n=1 Tax=Seminavis robusta TaxID=568900 RepID=A0A9N8DIB3_9STRA|nr:expressed unknown protein [Seminavis robusta]|eukprot:Sro78_g042590.1 n/a (351) ;mRNA; r:123176-124438